MVTPGFAEIIGMLLKAATRMTPTDQASGRIEGGIGSVSVRDYVFALIEEYKSLREEIQQISVNMYTSLSIGFGVISGVTAASLIAFRGSPGAMQLAFGLLVPFVARFTTVLWMGEVLRWKRAGDFICLIEAKIAVILRSVNPLSGSRNSHEQQPIDRLQKSLGLPSTDLDLTEPLLWERWLRVARTGHLRSVYGIRLVFLILVDIISFFGLYLVRQSPHERNVLLNLLDDPINSDLWRLIVGMILADGVLALWLILFSVYFLWVVYHVWRLARRSGSLATYQTP